MIWIFLSIGLYFKVEDIYYFIRVSMVKFEILFSAILIALVKIVLAQMHHNLLHCNWILVIFWLYWGLSRLLKVTKYFKFSLKLNNKMQKKIKIYKNWWALTEYIYICCESRMYCRWWQCVLWKISKMNQWLSDDDGTHQEILRKELLGHLSSNFVTVQKPPTLQIGQD